MIIHLFKKKCLPCKGGIPPLTHQEIEGLRNSLNTNWDTVDDQKLRRDFDFDNYGQVLKFVKKVGETAIYEDHHPIMHVYFRMVTLEFWTHVIKGLSVNDFIMAAKSDKIYHKINKHSADNI